jgi:hypothetical protein
MNTHNGANSKKWAQDVRASIPQAVFRTPTTVKQEKVRPQRQATPPASADPFRRR